MEAIFDIGETAEPSDDNLKITRKDFWHAQAMIYKAELQNCNKGLNRLNRRNRRLRREKAELALSLEVALAATRCFSGIK